MKETFSQGKGCLSLDKHPFFLVYFQPKSL
jgi:hypothetical protein